VRDLDLSHAVADGSWIGSLRVVVFAEARDIEVARPVRISTKRCAGYITAINSATFALGGSYRWCWSRYSAPPEVVSKIKKRTVRKRTSLQVKFPESPGDTSGARLAVVALGYMIVGTVDFGSAKTGGTQWSKVRLVSVLYWVT
jgi:hypothetical protein